jgi:uncharacterized damage-inducible protein DinB
MLARLPPDALAWRPGLPDGARSIWNTGEVISHLAECTAGFLAVLLRLRPEAMADVAKYRDMPLPQGVEPVRKRLALYREEIAKGLALLTAGDLAEVVPTVFVKEGEPVLTLLLGNLEHLVNHKHQLFLYLRLMGVEVSTPDLYAL